MNVIYKTKPIHTAENMPLDKTIEIYFMIDINKSTLNNKTLILYNITEQREEEIKFEYRNRLLKVNTVGLLQPKSHYQFHIVGGQDGIEDITGRVMAETYEVEFYTAEREEVKPPVVLKPTHLSVIKETPTFILEKAENAIYYNVQISKSNTFQNIVWPIASDQKIYELSFTPYIIFEVGQYYVRVRSVDEKGNESEWSDYVQFYFDKGIIEEKPEIPEQPEQCVSQNGIILKSFTKAKMEGELSNLKSLLEDSEEPVQPSIVAVSVTPKDKSLNNSLVKSKTIEIIFSEPLDETTITSSTCYVLSETN